MALLLAVIQSLIPLAIAPGLLFYFDVTPKIVLLLLGTAVAMTWWVAVGGVTGFHRASRQARWLLPVMCGMAASLAASTLASVNPALSLGGSAWRCWGLVTQLAVLALAYLVAACCAGRPERLRVMLRALAASGLIAAVYGAAQYFGWDPLQPSQSYHAGEGIFIIVRPPSTLGHADYFANWLLCAVFAGAALAWIETSRFWKWMARISLAAGCTAILLSGTRAALIGLLAGAVFLVLWRGLRVTRSAAVAAGLVVVALAAFYWSPAGGKLRARVHWSREDTAGGARLLLWRDSLRMAASRWPLGYGPDTFIASFARWQSADLARAYPDFYHESPHNIFLDVLVAQGVPGLLFLAALPILGFAAAWDVRRNQPPGGARDTAGALAAALAAMTIGGQFVCFTLPTALAYYVTIAMLVSLTCRVALKPRPVGRRWPALAAAVPCAGLLAVFAVRLLVAEISLASVRRDLDTALVGEAAAQYARYRDWRLPGASADFWYSRRLAQIAASQVNPAIRIQALQQGAMAAVHATYTAEDPFNACYNLAEFYASRDDFVQTEQSLRAAISYAPNWFKPHWMLAQVLQAGGRLKEADAEAVRAVTLDGGKHVEVTGTLDRIRAQLRPVPQVLHNK